MSTPDPYASESTETASSASGAFPIVPSNDGDLPFVTRRIFVGVGGDITVVMKDDEKTGNTNTFKNVLAGTQLDIRVVKVMQTGTGADMFMLGLG